MDPSLISTSGQLVTILWKGLAVIVNQEESPVLITGDFFASMGFTHIFRETITDERREADMEKNRERGI